MRRPMRRRRSYSYDKDPQSRPNVKFLCVLATGAGLITLIVLYLAGAPFFRALGSQLGSKSSSSSSSSSSGGGTPAPTLAPVAKPTFGPTVTPGNPTQQPMTSGPTAQPIPGPTTARPTQTPAPVPEIQRTAAVSSFGRFQVTGNTIVSAATQSEVQVAGMSLFWSNTGWDAEEYYDRRVVAELAQRWNVSIVRAAMGVEDEGGYAFNPDANENRVREVVEAAIQQDIYVIIDWHSHNAELYEIEAIDFFRRMASDYGSSPNVIFEIYNEPIATSWSVVKSYAEAVISVIRESSENLILVGTPEFSQRLDQAAADPITSFDNIAYVLHFYAASHDDQLRDYAQVALDANLAVFVSEWGAVQANGEGQVDSASVMEWIDWMNARKISHCNWSVNQKDEGASALVPGTGVGALPWDLPASLTPSGRLVLGILQDYKLN